MAKQKDAEQIRILTTFFENMEKSITNKDTTRNKLKKETGVSLERYKIREDMREPSLSAAVKIADALDVSLDELCGRTAYFHNSNELSAGEALELIRILTDSLFGRVSDDGLTIDLPSSNVTTVFEDCHEFGEHYAGMKKFDPDNYPLEPEVAKFNWLSAKIEELKKSKEHIEIYSDNGEYRIGNRVMRCAPPPGSYRPCNPEEYPDSHNDEEELDSHFPEEDWYQ